MTILYPVARTAESALKAPLGRAAREREAREIAGEEVAFTVETYGPAFASREALQEALGAWAVLPFASVRPLSEGRPPPPARPANLDGRRWPEPAEAAPPVWRLSVSYWRAGAAAEPGLDRRRAREAGREVSPAELRALAERPLEPFKPQQPLDIGLFEVRAPEAPHIVMPDE